MAFLRICICQMFTRSYDECLPSQGLNSLHRGLLGIPYVTSQDDEPNKGSESSIYSSG